MADPKGVDPFEAFKKKKAADAQQAKQQSKVDDANKQAGWIDGIGPVDKQDPTKPSGFTRGRYQKPVVKPEELSKLRPKKLEATQLATPKPTAPSSLPPLEERRPEKFKKI